VKSKTTIIAIAVLIGLACATAVGYWGASRSRPVEREGVPAEPTKAPVAVSVARVDLRDAQEFSEFTGSVQSRVSVAVMAQITGRIRTMAARSGMHVKKDELLVQLDADEIQSRVRQAQSGLIAARSALAAANSDWAASKSRLVSAEATRVQSEQDYRRYEQLFKQGVEPKQKQEQTEAVWRNAAAAVETSKANVEAAEAAVRAQEAAVTRAQGAIDEINAQLQYTDIRSPMEGIIVDKQAEAGDLATPGRILLTLHSPTELRLEAPISEHCAQRVRYGMPVRITIDSLGLSLDAQVSEVVPTIDPKSRSFLVRADLPPRPELQPGMFGRFQFPCGTQKVISIPDQAVFQRGQLEMAFVVAAGRARLRLIRTGRTVGNYAEILTGLSEGETVVVAPPPGLRDDDPIVASAAPVTTGVAPPAPTAQPTTADLPACPANASEAPKP
jgi:HlyD family secretion protein